MKELKAHHKLPHLLQATHLARSVYYYQCAASKTDKHAVLKDKIKSIFHDHKGRYGYRRVTQALRNENETVNHKTVQRLMLALGLKSTVRPKKYKSYRGQVGRTADNLLQREFTASRPNQKWVTDLTEFMVKGQKVYLSPIVDLFNQEIVSYEIRKSAHLPLVTNMLDKAIEGLPKGERPMVHSDQGWQYQHWSVQQRLRRRGLAQSMSRKGNCLDNAMAENFFGLLKTEMYHHQTFKDADDLIKSIEEYISYYNHKRIKLKLKGLSPVEYRRQA